MTFETEKSIPQVDEKVRESMHKLRQTWKDVFNDQILHQLDIRVNQLDPAWPVDNRSVEPRKVHVNPKFISSPASRTENPVAVAQVSILFVSLGQFLPFFFG